MKTTLKLTIFLLGAAFTGAPTAMAAQDEKPESAEAAPENILQVSVDVPPSWSFDINHDFVAEVFGGYVDTIFDRMGYAGEVEYAGVFDERPENGYRLNLRIIRWRMNYVGNIECVFTADLVTPAGEKHLGVFSDLTLSSITGRNRFWLADSFRDAAEGAIRQLYADVARTEMVPGIRERA
ncbi:MAG: hypothetical protein ACREIA_13370 [Opitutaceae bacterium]